MSRTAGTSLMAVEDEVVVPVYQAGAAPAGCLRRFDAVTGADEGCAAFDTVDPAQLGASDPWFDAVRLGRHVAVTQGFVTSTGELHAWLSVVDLVEPARSWTHRDTGPQAGLSNPIIVGDQLVVARSGPAGARLETWDLVDGCGGDPCAPVEVVDLIGSLVNGISARAGGRHVAVAALGRLLVVDRDAGAVAWSSPTAAGEPDRNVVPSWTADSLVVGSAEGNSTRVSVFAAGGCGGAVCSPTWEAVLPGRPSGQVATTPGLLLVGTRAVALAVFPEGCARTCAPVRLEPEEAPEGSPIVSGGLVYYHDERRSVVALRLPG